MKRHGTGVGFARELRQRQTDAERALWRHLRNMQVGGVKFRRQEPIGRYIVDFASFDRNLVIEIDGSQHGEAMEMEKDEQRTRWLDSRGFRVERFWSNEVLTNIDGVAERISEILGVTLT